MLKRITLIALALLLAFGSWALCEGMPEVPVAAEAVEEYPVEEATVMLGDEDAAASATEDEILMQAYEAAPKAASISISPKSKTIYTGEQFTINVYGTSKTPKFSSQKKKVAKVSSTGVVTGVKAGTAKITVKVGKKKFTCKVKVKQRPRVDLTRYLGGNIKTAASELGLHWDSIQYENSLIHMRTEEYEESGQIAAMGIDKKNPSYSIAGVYPGMKRGKAMSTLKKKGWRKLNYKPSYGAGCCVYYKNNNGWQLAIQSKSSSSSSTVTYVAAVSWEGAWS